MFRLEVDIDEDFIIATALMWFVLFLLVLLKAMMS